MTLDELIARDGATCLWCGRELWQEDLTAEHLLPRSRGGRGRPENLAVACRPCNRRRRSRGVGAFLRAQTDAGFRPRIELVERSLRRLAGSPSRAHADYGQRQLALVAPLLRDRNRP